MVIRKLIFFGTYLAGISLCFSPFLRAERFMIDSVHSDISFKIRHMVISKVQGRFDRFGGEFDYDEKDTKMWKASATIEAASINTANEKRDGHLRNADFFDVEKYPQLSFISTKVTDYNKKDRAKLHGLLTLHGVQKPVILDIEIGGTVKDPRGGIRAGFEASTKINRKDFGIVWNKVLDGGGLAIGEEVEISMRMEGVSQMPEEKPSSQKPAEK